MKPVANDDIARLRGDSDASGLRGTGAPPVRAVLIAAGDASRGCTHRQSSVRKDLLSLNGTQALLRLLRRHEVKTGVIMPPHDHSELTGHAIVEQAGQAGFSISASAFVTDCPVTAEAACVAGFGMVVLVSSAMPASILYPAEQTAAGTLHTVIDPSELSWTSARGLHIKTLDSLPHIEDPDHTLPARLVESRPLLFLDYDGTLTPIVDDPARAFLPQAVRDTLAELGRLTTVTIVSGRDLALLQHRVDLDHLWYAGSHGFEIAGPAGSSIAHLSGAEFSADLDAAEQDLNRLLVDFPGHLLERKRMTIAVHYRQLAPALAARLKKRVHELVEGFPALHLGHGKMVMEVRPAIEWNKGAAVAWIMSQLHEPARNALPVYIGDDLTDEDAFRTIAGRGIGIAVRHGEVRATSADFAVEDTDAVHALLIRLLAGLRACG